MRLIDKPIQKGKFLAHNIIYEIKWYGTMTDRNKEKHKLVAFHPANGSTSRTMVMDEETFRTTFKGVWS